MKTKSILLTALFAVGTLAAFAQAPVPEYRNVGDVVVTCMSPDGKTVGGTESTVGNVGHFRSFLYDTETKELRWITSDSDPDTDKGGAFAKVTDQGVIAGAIKDKNLTVDIPADDWSDGGTITLTSAAVWKSGKIYKLGIADSDKSRFTDESDGSYASGVSEDGSVVCGYVQWAYFPQISVRWEYDAGTDSYKGMRYSLPANTEISTTTGLSADGQVTVGNAFYNGSRHAIVWTSVDEYRVVDLGLENEYGMNGNAAAVSPNGKYALICVNAPAGPKIAIYDVEADKAEEVELDNVFEVSGYVIDNNGNFFCSVTDGTTFATQTYYYHAATKNLVGMNDFVKRFAPGLDDVPDLGKAQPVAVSTDGTLVAGSILPEQYGEIPQGWMLRVNNNAVIVPTVTGIRAFTSGIGRVTVKWDALSDLDEGVNVKEYKVLRNGQVLSTVPVGDVLPDGSYGVTFDADAGTYSFTVKAVCTHKDGEVESLVSDNVSVSVPSSYQIPMSENFESTSFVENCWTPELLEGDAAEVLNWNVSGGDFENNTYFASVTPTVLKPYKAALVSRFFDASVLDDVYVTFYSKIQFVNMRYENVDTEFLDLEYTVDGENWIPLMTVKASEKNIAAWNFTTADFSKELAGKQFKLRFVAHGEGEATLKWYLDYITIGKELDGKKPEGLSVGTKDGKVELVWKNSIGTYEKSYVVNSNVLTDYNIGNNGSPLIAAVSFPADKLADSEGKYISSVTTFIYDDPYFASEPTQAEAIVYADGVEVARQAFPDDVAVNPYPATVALSTPVKIEKGKEYKVAVRIHDYDPQQTPLYYQAVEEGLIAGVTDLYSEDEGKTWGLISEFNSENEDLRRSWCVWPIRANITDDSTPVTGGLKLDNTLLAYNVYRDGVQINKMSVYGSYLKFVDENPVEGAEYTVQAFYTDGRVSVLSDPAKSVSTSIDAVENGDGCKFDISQTSDGIDILGDFDSATLTATDGRVMAVVTSGNIDTAALAPGVYVLAVEKDGMRHAYKVLVK